MNETPAPDDFEELAGLLKAGFPDIRCLRCGYDKLYLASDEHSGLPGYVAADALESSIANHKHPFLVLTCARCGHVEHFLTGILERAKKPIERNPADE